MFYLVLKLWWNSVIHPLFYFLVTLDFLWNTSSEVMFSYSYLFSREISTSVTTPSYSMTGIVICHMFFAWSTNINCWCHTIRIGGWQKQWSPMSTNTKDSHSPQVFQLRASYLLLNGKPTLHILILISILHFTFLHKSIQNCKATVLLNLNHCALFSWLWNKCPTNSHHLWLNGMVLSG